MSNPPSSPVLHPLSPLPLLKNHYLHHPLTSLPTPSAILDLAPITRNCTAMLSLCSDLGVTFRAHVKSHKTLELAKLQVGSSPKQPANFIVSTLAEGENLLPFLRECQAEGRECSLLYGVPPAQSSIPRLLRLASNLTPGSVNILTDNVDAFLKATEQIGTTPIGIFIKIDTGYHRAGIQTTSPNFPSLVQTVIEKAGDNFRGFYSHYGHSYSGSTEEDAAHGLIAELQGLEEAVGAVPGDFKGKLVLTVGATPTATAAQNMLTNSPLAPEFKKLLGRLKEKYIVELHAGVYPLLDMQQVATHARPASGPAPLSKESIGFKILLEVSSVYDEREKPEVLVSAGSLALGREPCKSYPGWGIVAGPLGNKDNKVYDERGDKTGWIVGRISQEHGILTWEGPREQMKRLAIGDKVLVWPNHACVAGAGFGWYLVVDSDKGGDTVVDIWVRWRGW